MLTIVQRGGATREKPPEIVRRHASRLPWAWAGLCFAVPFNEPVRDAARDLIFNVAPSGIVGTLTWIRDDRGSSALHLDSGGGIDYPDTAAHNQPQTEITTYVRLRNGGTGQVSAGVFGKEIDTVDPWNSWLIQHSDSGGSVLAAQLTVNSAYTFWESGYVLPTTKWVSVFLRWRSGGAATLDILDERGQSLSSTNSGVTQTGSITYAAGKPIQININTTGQNRFDAYYSQAMLWSRRLTDTEMQALVADPYGWYSPRRETIGLSSPYPLVFGGGEMRFGTGSGGLR